MKKLVAIKDFAEFIRTGKTPPTKETHYFGGDIQWFTPGDLDKRKYLIDSQRTLTKLSFDDKKAVRFPSDTLLVACIGDIGKLGITTKECSSNQQITGIKPKNNVDISYLYYWFLQSKKMLKNHANNAVVPILNNRTLEQILVPLPPLAEQKQIAAILDAADSLRQKDQQLVEHYTSLSQSLFLDMFGEPTSNALAWSKIELGSLAKISSGSTPSRSNDDYYQGEIPWVKTTEVKGSDIFETSENISEKALEETSCKLYPSGSLIIAMYGQGKTRGKVGRLMVEAATNQACAVIPPSEKMNYDFLYSVLKMSYQDLRSLGRGGNQPNLNSGLIKSYNVINPPIELQNKFAERVAIIEKQKQQAQMNLEKSEMLFNSLLQRAFTGELTANKAA